MTTPTPNDFTPARLAALDIFTNHSEILTWRSAQFLGQVAGGFHDDLSDKQEAWLQTRPAGPARARSTPTVPA